MRSLTVITLSRVPKSLRGYLSRWMQEIHTGVFVGIVNQRVRTHIWEDILENVKNGEATMTYKTNNDIGYDFITHGTRRTVKYYDGVPIVFVPKATKNTDTNSNLKRGFSNASKYSKARKFGSRNY